MNAIDVQQVKEFEVVLRWESNASNDMIADSTLALIVSIESSPASVKGKFALIGRCILRQC